MTRDFDAAEEERWYDEHGSTSPPEGVRLVTASTVQIERPEWLWSGRVPLSAVTLVAGREGRGKTALVLDLAARVTRGQLEGDRAGRPAHVAWIGVEDDPAAVLVPRLTAAGADLDRVHLVTAPAGVPFTVTMDGTALDELLDPLDCAVVVVDPLDAHLGGQIDTHRKSEVQRTVGLLARMAQDHRLAVVGIGHLNKGDAADVLTRVVGSVGFTTSVRSVIGVGEHPDDPADRIAVVSKSNLTNRATVPALRFRVEEATVPHPDGGEVITAGVVWLGEEHGVDPDSVVRVIGEEERRERDEAADFLTELLAAGPMPYKEVEQAAKDEGIARATLHRARRLAGVEVERDGTARGRPSTWRLSSPPDFVSPRTPPGETKSKRALTCTDATAEGVSSQGTDAGETDTKPATVRVLEAFPGSEVIREQ